MTMNDDEYGSAIVKELEGLSQELEEARNERQEMLLLLEELKEEQMNLQAQTEQRHKRHELHMEMDLLMKQVDAKKREKFQLLRSIAVAQRQYQKLQKMAGMEPTIIADIDEKSLDSEHDSGDEILQFKAEKRQDRRGDRSTSPNRSRSLSTDRSCPATPVRRRRSTRKVPARSRSSLSQASIGDSSTDTGINLRRRRPTRTQSGDVPSLASLDGQSNDDKEAADTGRQRSSLRRRRTVSQCSKSPSGRTRRSLKSLEDIAHEAPSTPVSRRSRVTEDSFSQRSPNRGATRLRSFSPITIDSRQTKPEPLDDKDTILHSSPQTSHEPKRGKMGSTHPGIFLSVDDFPDEDDDDNEEDIEVFRKGNAREALDDKDTILHTSPPGLLEPKRGKMGSAHPGVSRTIDDFSDDEDDEDAEIEVFEA